MGDNAFLNRIFGYLLFDITHIDSDIITIYIAYAENRMKSFISTEPDLSSEIFHWERYCHQYNIENPNEQIFSRYKHAKPSILSSIKLLKNEFNEQLNCLDVGCGPTSQFYSEDLENRNDIILISVDPLADFYMSLLKKYNIKYTIKCIPGYGEKLDELFSKDTFHLIYTQNAIDHSQNPNEFIKKMFYILKPRGIIVFFGFIKEGTAAHWIGLHQWDIEIDNDDLVLSSRDKSINRINLTRYLNIRSLHSIVEGNDVGDKYTMIYQKN